MRNLVIAFGCVVVAAGGAAGQTFTNWETAVVHPLELTPDAGRLLAVNLPDNRLEVYQIVDGMPLWLGSVALGLDPVTVRARTDGEAWVVNHISDSVNIVDLNSLRVVRTLVVGDEPTDVVFAGTPQRAFVCVSQLNEIRVFDPANLDAAPVGVAIAGEDPRSLATDGTRVFAAIFESGTQTTILSQFEVSDPAGPYGGLNPPPNAGATFDPPIAGGLPPAPAVGLIVRKDGQGVWRDDNGADWSNLVTWDVHDHDVAIVDANTLTTTYATGLMNLNMAIAVRPGGEVTAVGTEALNHIRFEPKLRGTFVRSVMARVNTTQPVVTATGDLNPHLTYAVASVPPAMRAETIGEPRGVAWNAAGDRGYVAGMGSNNVIAIDAAGGRLGRAAVGRGPTGLALDEGAQRLYVLNRFDNSISVVDSAAMMEIQRVRYHDATPAVIRTGRPHLYDTQKSSGLGQASCASCHPEARMDQIAWDLGNPAGQMKTRNVQCASFPVNGPCGDWHPMKGPMVTQLLLGSVGSPPLHWRGDRENLAAFNPTFTELQAADAQLTTAEMNEFSAFLTTIQLPPNPYRNFDGSLKATLPNGGHPAAATGLLNACGGCHFPGQGFNSLLIPAAFRGDSQSFNTSHLRLMHEKVGFDRTRMDNSRGFGFLHDGHTDTLIRLLSHPVFAPGGASATFAAGAAGDQQRLDVEAFLLSELPTQVSTPPSIGEQTTLIDAGNAPPGQVALLDSMTALIDSVTFPRMGLVVKGRVAGEQRGYYYLSGGSFQADRAAQTIASATLRGMAAAGSELTYTMVPDGAKERLGVDRDEDGFYDRDEIDACSDPANALSVPGSPGGDIDRDGDEDVDDVSAFVAALVGTPLIPQHLQHGDMNCDGRIDGLDIPALIRAILL